MSQGLYFNKTMAANMAALPRPQHKLFFSGFVDAAMACVGDAAFAYHRAKTPLAGKDGSTRGSIAEEVVKKVLEGRGDKILRAEASMCVNGKNRGKGHERRDFGRVVPSTTRRCRRPRRRRSWGRSPRFLGEAAWLRCLRGFVF